jgi:hypothetical protein
VHYRCKDAAYELVHANGSREILRAVLRYSFDWQLQYGFKTPVLTEKVAGWISLRQQSQQSGQSRSGKGDPLGGPERG